MPHSPVHVQGEIEYKVKLKQVETDWVAYKKLVLREPLTETEKDSSDIGFQLSDETNDTQILTDNEETTETVSDSNDWTPDFTNALKEWESI